jgi:hypothetical protein
MTLGDLLEGIVLHAFEGRSAFTEASRRRTQAVNNEKRKPSQISQDLISISLA